MARDKKTFTFTIRGKDLRPETLPVSELTKILANLEQAFLETAKASGVADTRGLYLALKTVDNGSVKLTCVVPVALAPALAHDAELISQRKPGRIAPGARRQYHELAKFLQTKNWVGRFHRSRSLHIPGKATIGDWVPPVEIVDGPIRERSLVYGIVVRVGGEPALVDLVPFDSRRTLKIRVTRELAVELANHLYKSVSVEGDAELDPVTLDPVFMIADDWAPYVDEGPDKALKALAEVAGTMWDDVDPHTFLDEFRRGDVA